MDGRVEDMKNYVYIFYTVNVTRNAQHSKATMAKDCGFLGKLNKNIDISWKKILTN